MANSGIKQHVSIEERNVWNKVVEDFASHLGVGGVSNHPLGDGNIPGFSTNDYSNADKTKVTNIEAGALNNPHPATHPHTMITGLHQVASTGNYYDLKNIPTSFGNAETVGGIRITIGTTAPSNPQPDKELWIDTSQRVPKVYTSNGWFGVRAVYGTDDILQG